MLNPHSNIKMFKQSQDGSNVGPFQIFWLVRKGYCLEGQNTEKLSEALKSLREPRSPTQLCLRHQFYADNLGLFFGISYDNDDYIGTTPILASTSSSRPHTLLASGLIH